MKGTALTTAVGAGSVVKGPLAESCVEVVSALVAAGPDVNAQDGIGSTALDTAANEGEVEVARILIVAGADVNGGTDTPLFFTQRIPVGTAPSKEKAEIAEMLRAQAVTFDQFPTPGPDRNGWKNRVLLISFSPAFLHKLDP